MIARTHELVYNESKMRETHRIIIIIFFRMKIRMKSQMSICSSFEHYRRDERYDFIRPTST